MKDARLRKIECDVDEKKCDEDELKTTQYSRRREVAGIEYEGEEKDTKEEEEPDVIQF